MTRPRSVALKKYSPVSVPFKAIVPDKPHVSTPARGDSSLDTISLSFMKPHTQQNAKLGKLDHLYAKNISGSGQMVAVIEYSGEWQQLRNVIQERFFLRPEIQKRYELNFLTSIGGRQLHPEERNAWLRLMLDGDSHGSNVSSVVMDFAPHTKVLPVSTYYSPKEGLQTHHFYDTADALMDLARRKDVNIINISGGYVHILPSEVKRVYDANGQLIDFLFKDVFAPKIIEAFKAVAKAGKVVVLAAGNEEGYIESPDFTQKSQRVTTRNFIGHLLQTLDPETRKAILIAGNVDPLTHKLSRTSNKPGPWREAQERFVCGPGSHELSYINLKKAVKSA